MFRAKERIDEEFGKPESERDVPEAEEVKPENMNEELKEEKKAA